MKYLKGKYKNHNILNLIFNVIFRYEQLFNEKNKDFKMPEKCRLTNLKK